MENLAGIEIATLIVNSFFLGYLFGTWNQKDPWVNLVMAGLAGALVMLSVITHDFFIAILWIIVLVINLASAWSKIDDETSTF